MAKQSPSWLKPLADYGPLAAFLAGYSTGDLMTATIWLMIATGLATVALFIVERRVPWMPLMTAAIVGVFGGLTLWLNDETFIKLKPTIIQSIFSVTLLGGLLFGKSLLKPVFGGAWKLSPEAWRTLTLRYGLFFASMAVLNEIVWRTQSTDVWVTFKLGGLIGLSIIFTLTQMPLILRETREAEARGDT
jgi:intracellular septation protein